MLKIHEMVLLFSVFATIASPSVIWAINQDPEPVNENFNERTIPLARCFEHTKCNSCWIAIEKRWEGGKWVIWIDCVKCDEPDPYFEFKTCHKYGSTNCVILLNPTTPVSCENCKIWRTTVDDEGAGVVLGGTCSCAPSGGHSHTWQNGSVWYQICR